MKEIVIGVNIDGIYKAYPFSVLSQIEQPLIDTVNGKKISIYFDADSRSGKAMDEAGNMITSLTSYWFAWYAFHPNTEVFK